MWVATGVIKDAGTASGPNGLTSIGTIGSGPTICANSGPITGAYNRVCLTATATAGGITMNNIGGGTGGFTFALNGVVQGLATVTLPVTTNDVACFADTSGTLKDCGLAPLTNVLAHTHIFVGNGANVATDYGAFATFGDTGTLTITPTTGDGTKGLVINQTTGGSTPTNTLNTVIITDQNSGNAATSTAAFSVQMVAGASASAGNTVALQGVAGTVANTNTFYGFGMQGLCQATNTATAPTGLGGAGQCAGANLNGQLLAGATGYLSVFGAEVDVTVVAALSGSAPKYKAGLAIAHNSSDAVRGATYDAALSVSSNSATVIGWKYGLLFSTAHSQQPFTSSSIIIGALGGPQVVTSFIDFSTYTCSGGSEINFTNFVVDCAAKITDTINAIGVTSADGLIFQNTTAAAAGAQQYSPRIRLTGQGWKTTATAASQTVDWIVENQPVQGAANPTTNLVISQQINGGGYSMHTAFIYGSNINIPAAPSDSNARFIATQNSLGQGLYGVDSAGSVYLWCVSCSATIFGTLTSVPVDFYANNIKTFTLVNAASLALSSVYVRSTLAATSTTAAALRVDGGIGLAGDIQGGGIVNVVTGYRIGGAATSGNVLRGNGTNFVSATLATSDLSDIGTFNLNTSGTIKTTNVTVASSKTTGSGIFGGGIGVAGATFTDTLNIITVANAATTAALCWNSGTGLVTENGAVGTCTVSDERLKNMGPRITGALDKLLKINGVHFTWKDPQYGIGPQIGVGAQTVEKVFPELVSTDSEGKKSADYQRLTAPIIEALRELKADNDNLRGKLDQLEQRRAQR